MHLALNQLIYEKGKESIQIKLDNSLNQIRPILEQKIANMQEGMTVLTQRAQEIAEVFAHFRETVPKVGSSHLASVNSVRSALS